MEKIKLYNQISHEIVKNYNTYLHPEDVKLLKTIDVPAHYTIVNRIDISLAEKLNKIAIKLKEIDDSILLNDYHNYHISLFWKDLDSRLPEKNEKIKDIISSYSYKFNVEELLFGPLGISIKFYPTDESFVETKIKLCELTNTPIFIDERFVTTWVHLGAFTQIPKTEVKKFVQDNCNIKFGSYNVLEFTLYKSTNKWLLNPEKIKEFNCK